MTGPAWSLMICWRFSDLVESAGSMVPGTQFTIQYCSVLCVKKASFFFMAVAVRRMSTQTLRRFGAVPHQSLIGEHTTPSTTKGCSNSLQSSPADFQPGTCKGKATLSIRRKRSQTPQSPKNNPNRTLCRSARDRRGEGELGWTLRRRHVASRARNTRRDPAVFQTFVRQRGRRVIILDADLLEAAQLQLRHVTSVEDDGILISAADAPPRRVSGASCPSRREVGSLSRDSQRKENDLRATCSARLFVKRYALWTSCCLHSSACLSNCDGQSSALFWAFFFVKYFLRNCKARVASVGPLAVGSPAARGNSATNSAAVPAIPAI